MKKLLSALLFTLFLLNLVGCGFSAEECKVGETYVSNGIEFTVNELKFTEVIDGWEGANDDFWKPVDNNNCNVGGRYSLDEYKVKYGLSAPSEDDQILFISYNAKNVAKSDKTIDDIGIVDYDDGYEYSDGSLAYRVSEEGVWKKIPNGLVLEQLKENEYEFRAYIIIPKEAVNSNKSLTYTLYGMEYNLREV